mmetsp:Transcript_48860/g.110889  ORF Transcript_48860/g.110889 Transcript_48860/m.110889 type:complete len:175 (-) Transcript_48860:450-974(-)|eukprot:CAMPEP_0172630612 /NCGR_PEP_ID=MMETSP1068-20121228/174567_1 /TAXON_ID=35684 /ORGANISM="Pseudopedinella elastica, Strain CCMP716" /LENGTH=174 /DNA_ID=CAMNT_0013441501 /DNA_START=82 /DNA_END=606 /DNA_ORIENTATION=+
MTWNLRLFFVVIAAGATALNLSPLSQVTSSSPRKPSSRSIEKGLGASRRTYFAQALAATSAVAAAVSPVRADVGEILSAAARNSEITYSQNAKNFGRLAEGDSSAGSRYEDPKTPAAAKRRAMTGCKVALSRKEAGGMSEKDCNIRIMGGDTDFMVDALQRLDCPTCPYGIKGA